MATGKHGVEKCKTPKIRRCFKQGAVWGCPTCGKLWRAGLVGGYESCFWTWKALP